MLSFRYVRTVPAAVCQKNRPVNCSMSAVAASIAAASSKSSVVLVMLSLDFTSCMDVYQVCGVSGNEENVPGNTFWSRVPVTTHAYAHMPSEVMGMFAV